MRTVAGYSLDRCPDCGSVLADRCPADSEVAAIYEELFAGEGYLQHRREFEALKAGRRQCGRYRLAQLRRLGREVEGRVMVELGGGTGAFGVEAVKAGWSYTDHDISPHALDCARQLGLDARSMEPHAFPRLDPGSVDAVVMWEVLEHIWPVHAFLGAARESLRPGGALLLSTPNWRRSGYQRSDSWGPLSSPPVHLGFFDPPALEAVLRGAGFGRVRCWTRRLYAPVPPSRKAFRRSWRLAVGLEPGPTLYALARV
ncbi:MAG: class I SAM-dependent methyltransferase [Holophagales bacterium]|nr:class I SAM-dependent methyltransferase [Holophagales bacterium]